ncbi:H-type lectin domain-containing protein [Streptomyces flavidovirens]
MTSSHTQTRALAGALRRNVERVGAVTPAVRGGDYRQAVVSAVGADGTVTADSIVARRLEVYQAPAVGDLITLFRSSAGDWVTPGRFAGPGVARAEQSGTLNMSWTTVSSIQQAVTFPVAFSTAPRVMTNIHSSDGAVARWGSRAISITTTGFTVFLFAPVSTATSSGASIPVQWIAVAP